MQAKHKDTLKYNILNGALFHWTTNFEFTLAPALSCIHTCASSSKWALNNTVPCYLLAASKTLIPLAEIASN
jgi:hypothetical protein